MRNVVTPHYGADQLGDRTVNELLALAATIDALLRGDLSNALDQLAQRIRGIEEFCRTPRKCGNRWALANEVMLRQDLSVGSLTDYDRKAAIRAAERTAKQADAETRARGSR